MRGGFRGCTTVAAAVLLLLWLSAPAFGAPASGSSSGWSPTPQPTDDEFAGHTGSDALERLGSGAELSLLQSLGSIQDTIVDLLGLEREYERESWEGTYLIVVSSIGALWLAGRVLLHWTFDTSVPGFVPRSRWTGSDHGLESRNSPLGSGSGSTSSTTEADRACDGERLGHAHSDREVSDDA